MHDLINPMQFYEIYLAAISGPFLRRG